MAAGPATGSCTGAGRLLPAHREGARHRPPSEVGVELADRRAGLGNDGGRFRVIVMIDRNSGAVEDGAE